ncbi:MipA/OmpV family protein [Rhodoferax aquaticus]|uniref:MipA/OmpV family protein n=1 Tax=Rhodoferax aquaticus TaxID=2527691 RepID=A0A515ERR8_9BURK|nr:MipA/OmpV family protein [Rhodoferax aquaticus]QDL55355.1 MipA/OmpV family protein [Rhodoferax aquaticus]
MKLSFSHQHRHVSLFFKGLLLTLALPCAAAWAQADGKAPAGRPSSGGFIGVGVGSGPTYPGSDQQRTAAVPIGEYRWANGVYVGGRDGLLGVQMSATQQLQLGLAIGMDTGRKESDSSYLAGMGDIAAKGTLNAYAKLALSEQWGLSSSVQLGAGSAGKGGLLNLGASYSIPVAPSTHLSLNAGATLANADYMQDYFGVNSTQASASGYKSYTPSAGLRDVSVGLGLHHQFDRNWMLIGGLTSTSLSNAAKDSPLVRKSTSQNAFVAVAYSF